jgi:hypothetical protein
MNCKIVSFSGLHAWTVLLMLIPNLAISQKASEVFDESEAAYAECVIGLHASYLRRVNGQMKENIKQKGGVSVDFYPKSYREWILYSESLSWNCIQERQRSAALYAVQVFGHEQARNANLVELGDKLERKMTEYLIDNFMH